MPARKGYKFRPRLTYVERIGESGRKQVLEPEKLQANVQRDVAVAARRYSEDRKISLSQLVERSLDTFLTISITVYIIRNKLTKKFHLGYYAGYTCHDVHWHYINNTANGTVGDEIRRFGFSFFEFEIIGKFSNLKHALHVFVYYKKSLEVKYDRYKSRLVNDDLVKLGRVYRRIKDDRRKRQRLIQSISLEV
jgi:hypothetical protein